MIVQELEERVQELMDEDGVIPSRASDIRAKKRKKKRLDERLDRDTRLSGAVGSAAHDHDGAQRSDSEIVLFVTADTEFGTQSITRDTHDLA